ncbi:hypothetical protein BKA70DRAFT_1225771 [Coprinopsis sp. MPI-PUGE-AT-0042]|nr:hypothetical protein BKA70DRAFT_1225771 [Coprinopsis sp. MPI-PUGE-AT-0042]
MAPTTCSQSRPQPPPKEVEKPPQRVSGDRFKSSRSRCLWESRKKVFSTDPVFHLGGHFARTINPFVGIAQMVQLETREARNKDRREHQTYLALLRLLLLQGEDLVNSIPAIHMHIVGMLSKGQFKAWSADLRASQELLSQHLGFDDKTVGRLLCPASCDWHNEDSSVVPQGKAEVPFRAVHRPHWVLAQLGDTWKLRLAMPSASLMHNTVQEPSATCGGWQFQTQLFERGPNKITARAEHGGNVGATGDFGHTFSPFQCDSTIVITTLGGALRGGHTEMDSRDQWKGFLQNNLLVMAIVALDAQDTNTRKRAKQLFTMLSHHLYEHQHDSGVEELTLWWDWQLKGLGLPKPRVFNGQPASGLSMLDRLKAHSGPEH